MPVAAAVKPKASCAEHSSSRLESQCARPGQSSRRAYWAATIPATSLTAPLVLISMTCGMLDATTYMDFKIFSSNQTGNALILTLLAVGLPAGSTLALVLASLMSFLLLAFLAGAVARAVGPRRRSWLVASLAAQATLFVLPPALLSSGVLQVHGQYDWVLVGLLAAGSGVQVAMARASSNPELPSAMLTSPFVDLLTDPYLFVPLRHPQARARNVRTLYIASIISGSFLGAGLIKAGAPEAVWWLVVALRLANLAWVLALGAEEPSLAQESPCAMILASDAPGARAIEATIR